MKRFFTLLALCLLVVACNDASRNPVIKGYRIHQVGGLGFGLDGLAAEVILDVDVENPTKARYTVESMHADIFPAGDTIRFAGIDLKKSTSIQPHSSGNVSFPLDVKIKRPLSMLGGFTSDEEEKTKYEADLDMTIRKGSMKKKIRKSRVPLGKILEMLGRNELFTIENTESNE